MFTHWSAHHEAGITGPRAVLAMSPKRSLSHRESKHHGSGNAGRTAIICASSRGLGRGAAFALAEAGCKIVVNGRDAARLDQTAADIRAATGATVIAVAADVSTREGQQALLGAAGIPDILINNNGGPPPKAFARSPVKGSSKASSRTW